MKNVPNAPVCIKPRPLGPDFQAIPKAGASKTPPRGWKKPLDAAELYRIESARDLRCYNAEREKAFITERDRRRCALNLAIGSIKCFPEDFSVAGAMLANLFPSRIRYRRSDPEFFEYGSVRKYSLETRIDQARRMACDPYGSGVECPGWFLISAVGRARMTILAITLAAEYRANDFITPQMCPLAKLPWGELEGGRSWINWKTSDWPHANQPDPKTIDCLTMAIGIVWRFYA